MTLLYNVLDDNLNIEDLIEPCYRVPSWVHGVPLLLGGFKSIAHWFAVSDHNDNIPKTIRQCPGISDYLKKCFLIKFPVDILLHTTVNGEYRWRIPTPLNHFNITSHPEEQFQSKSTIIKGKMNIKISLPLSLTADKKTECIFADPAYHSSVDYSVMPGVIKLHPKTENVQPINLFFDKKEHTYHFKAGQPLCYIMLCNGKAELEKNTKKLPPFYHKRFLGEYRKDDV